MRDASQYTKTIFNHASGVFLRFISLDWTNFYRSKYGEFGDDWRGQRDGIEILD